ncbi:MAG: cupin domain-containing protein [Desulfobacterales bacterium]|nr:cupin domain-containing protein [Desulfobacterales bacterium]
MIPFDPERSFEIFYVEIDPGGAHEAEPHHGHVEEYIFVTRGTLEVTLDETRHTIRSNQCIRFLADAPHQYRGVGDAPVNAIMQLCYLP